MSEPTLLFELATLKLVAFFVFLGMFLIVLIRVLTGPRRRYENQARIPLSDDTIVEPRDEDAAHG